MTSARGPQSPVETARLAALASLAILDTPPEPAFDDLAALASTICDTPIAIVAFVGVDRQWNKAHLGIDIAEVPLHTSICAQVIRDPGRVLVVDDTAADERFADFEFVRNAPHVRFYAGAPIVLGDGAAVGTIAVIDRRPRTLHARQREGLDKLARQAATLLDARRADAQSRKSSTGEDPATTANRLRVLTDQLPALIGHVDAEERFTFANARAAKTFGRTVEDVIGRTIIELRGKESYDRIAGYIAAALTGQHVTFENHGFTNGTRYDLETRYVPELDANGRVRGFYALTLDITARKLAERRVAETEERLRGITNNVPALIAEFDREGRFRFCNETYRAWLGVDPQGVIGQRIEDVVSREYWEGRRAQFAAALAGQRVVFDQVVLLPIGRRCLQTTYIPHEDENGALAGVYALTLDITELKDIQQRLDTLARIDALTGLANRRAFEERVASGMARTRRSGVPMAVLYLDIDRFKGINDSLGHAGGDAVLVEFAARLRSIVRETDVVARYAGDEFVVALEGVANESEARAVADKVVATIRPEFDVLGRQLHVTTSVGVALFAGGLHDVSTLLSLADRALYTAKSNGRDQVAVAKP
jgi:diguanylate cyclase (GGDEF)-like protein/PAS domain S-box-containing protein